MQQKQQHRVTHGKGKVSAPYKMASGRLEEGAEDPGRHVRCQTFMSLNAQSEAKEKTSSTTGAKATTKLQIRTKSKMPTEQ